MSGYIFFVKAYAGKKNAFSTRIKICILIILIAQDRVAYGDYIHWFWIWLALDPLEGCVIMETKMTRTVARLRGNIETDAS